MQIQTVGSVFVDRHLIASSEQTFSEFPTSSNGILTDMRH